MRRIRRIGPIGQIERGVAIGVLLLAAFHGAAAADYVVSPPLPDDPLAVHLYTLDNGLTVYLSAYREAPRFYAEISVRAGSKDDPPETTGLAHYFEHLMFKGSHKMGTTNYAQEAQHLDAITELYEEHFKERDEEKRAALYAQIDALNQKVADFAIPNELDRVYSAMGGRAINAHTWHEETVYKVNLPKNRMAHWATLEADRFAQPVFRLFPTELETVYEEKNRSMDNKRRIIMEAVDKLLYKKHPYGQQTTLGSPEHLKKPSIKNIQGFFETWYTPNNMAIAISGDIDIEETIAVIDGHFSAWQAKELPERKTWTEDPLTEREYVEVSYQGEEFVLLGFRTVPRGHEETETLQVLDMILDNATAGLINLNLNQKQAVRQAGSYPMQLNDGGAQYLYGIPKDGQTLEEVEQLLLDQIDILKRGDFDDWILAAIVNDYKKREKSALEDNTSRVRFMTQAFLAEQSWQHAIGLIDRIERVTKDDVVAAANRYFGSGYVAGYRKDAPHEVLSVEKPPLTKVDIDPSRQSDFAAELMALPAEPIAPVYVSAGKDYTKRVDQEGIAYYHAPNPVNDIFTFSITVDFGTHEDNTIGPAVRLLDKSGTQRFGPEELKKEWYKLGTDFGIGAGDNETTITLSGLDENFEASVALMMALLRQPTADEATLDELKKIILVQRADAKKQAEGITAALVQYNRFGKDSRFLRLLPEAELTALTVDELHAVTQALLSYKQTWAYAGSLSAERVSDILAQHYPEDASLKDPPPYRHLKARRPETSQVYFHNKKVAQSTVRLEFGSIDYEEALIPAIQLYNEYFSGGMAGIVFQELREARGLAYYAGARYITGYRKEDEGLMIGVIQTQADKTSEAAAAFVELLDEMPLSEERFALAKESILNTYRTSKIGFRDVTGAVRGWERHALEGDPRKARFASVEAAGIDVLDAFHKEYIANHPKLISVVGPEESIDMEALGEQGGVETIPLERIFID